MRRPRGAPKPPPHIWAELEEAGRTNDAARLLHAEALYEMWLQERGWRNWEAQR